jgi:hypothetical protein
VSCEKKKKSQCAVSGGGMDHHCGMGWRDDIVWLVPLGSQGDGCHFGASLMAFGGVLAVFESIS